MAEHDDRMGKPGRIIPPYPASTCGNVACNRHLGDGVEVYVYRDLDCGKLALFCDDCARHAELNFPNRFVLVPF